MKRSILFVFLLSILISPITLFATTVTFDPVDGGGFPISSGDWNESDNWSPIGIPSPGDIIIIPEGKKLDINEQLNWGSSATTTFVVFGELHFDNGKKITLSCGSNVIVQDGSITKGNGGGNSNYINICNNVVWNAATGDLNNVVENFAGIPSPIALPIELKTFKAYTKGSNIEIYWSTASESNNDFFSVERSIDGENFEIIGEIEGAGNSNQFLEYIFTDKEPLDQVSYYRLKQTDYNLDYSYSEIVAVKSEVKKEQIFKVYPNPVNKSESIKLYVSGLDSKVLEVSVYNSYGRLVFSKDYNNSESIETSLNFHQSIPQGTYFITFVLEDKVFKKKLIIKD